MQTILKWIRSVFSFGVVVSLSVTLTGIFTWTGSTFVIGFIYLIVCLLAAMGLDKLIKK